MLARLAGGVANLVDGVAHFLEAKVRAGDDADDEVTVETTSGGGAPMYSNPEISAEDRAEAERQYAEVVARHTNANGTRKAGWMKAPNGKPTRLGERQWVQVRTENFKRWFGDWETLAETANPRVVATVTEAAALVRASGILNTDIHNAHLGITARISGNSLSKMESESATKKSASPRLHALAVANVDRLFASARIEMSHPDKHGRREVKNIRRLGSVMLDPETGSYVPVMLTAIEYVHLGRSIYTVEAVDVGGYEENAAGQLADSGEAGDQVPIAAFVKSIADLASKVKPDNVSKVVDENGEPLVVWHDSGERHNVLSRDYARKSMDIEAVFFHENRDKFHEYGPVEHAVFLNIKNPANFAKASEGFSPGSTDDAGVRQREKLQAQGYDGFWYSGEEMGSPDLAELGVFESNQIKSATDNVGTFSPANPDIRFSNPDAVRDMDDDALVAAQRDATKRRGAAAVAFRKAAADELRRRGFRFARSGREWTWTKEKRRAGREQRKRRGAAAEEGVREDGARAPSGRQKQAGVEYPDASREIPMFSNAEVRYGQYRDLLAKRRPDLDADAVVDELRKLGAPKKEKIALHWIVRGGLQLPEDAYKVDDALSVAEKAKVDPFKYRSPDELLLANKEFKPTRKPIDPATVPELSDPRDEGDGIVSYEVQDDRAGQRAMRRIIDTHWGEDANPWCLLAKRHAPVSWEQFDAWESRYHDWEERLTEDERDKYGYADTALRDYYAEHVEAPPRRLFLNADEGGLDDAWNYWRRYSALPKRVAFKDGKLLAFMATDKEPILLPNKEVFNKVFGEKNWGSSTVERFRWYINKSTDELVETMRTAHPKNAARIQAFLDNREEAWFAEHIIYQWWDRKDVSHPDLDWARDADGADGGAMFSNPEISAEEEASRMDERDGTELSGIIAVAKAMRSGARPQSRNRFFKIAKTTDEQKSSGLAGDYFTIREGVVLRHDGKDAGHSISPDEWIQIAKGIVDPILVERYGSQTDGRSYRLWIPATVNGRNAIVGATVKSVGRNIDVNSISTVFGADHPKIIEENIVYDKRSRSERDRALLIGQDSRTYRVVSEREESLEHPQEKVNSESQTADSAVMFSTPHVFTGSAADYAHRVPVLDKDGKQTGWRIDNGPSLLRVGTGEGSQVYGWGLYGSNVRGVAESYGQVAKDDRNIYKDGRLLGNGDFESPGEWLINMHREAADPVAAALQDADGRGGDDFYERAKKEILASKWKIEPRHQNIYEQTFFTNRATPEETERHLLKWYDDVPREQLKWIADQMNKERGGDGWHVADGVLRHRLPMEEGDVLQFEDRFYGNGERIYHKLTQELGSPRAASEFLAHVGIDGIKYPVDSYGRKTVKDGDKVGWNYVSFRDDNITVDHKWVDGQPMFSNAGIRGAANLGITNLADAERMEKDGADRTAIWRQTGWWRGADGKWRVEIPDITQREVDTIIDSAMDQFAKIRKDGRKRKYGVLSWTLRDLVSGSMDFPTLKTLIKAYPELANLPIRISPAKRTPKDNYLGVTRFELERDAEGRLVPHDIIIPIGFRRKAMVRGTLVHELQHVIQAYEGFKNGGTTEGGDVDAGRDSRSLDVEQVFALGGEVEARLSSLRATMSADQRRAEPPWETMRRMLEHEAENRRLRKILKENGVPSKWFVGATGGLRTLVDDNILPPPPMTRSEMIDFVENRIGDRPWETEDVAEANQVVMFSNPDVRRVTPEEDAAYMDAVRNGDMDTARRMVDEAAKKAGYTIRAYHGTRSGEFTVFDESRTGQNYGGYNAAGGGFDFTSTEGWARRWGAKAQGNGNVRVMPVYLKADKTFYSYDSAVDPELAALLPTSTTQAKRDSAMKNGAAFHKALDENGIDFKSAIRRYGYDSYAMYPGADNISIYDPQHIKSADPVTYDDAGNVIPLSQRFDAEKEDIRFSNPEIGEDVRKAFANDPETREWTIITRPSTIASMPARHLGSLPPVTESTDNKSVEKAMKKLFADFGEVKNTATMERVVFNRADAGKMMMQSGADMRVLSPHLKALFEDALPAWSEPPIRIEGRHFDYNATEYRNYVAKFDGFLDEKNGINGPAFIRFTVRIQKGGRHGVHAATVTAVSVIENKSASGTGPAQKLGGPTRAFADSKLTRFLGKVKDENSSDRTPGATTFFKKLQKGP